MRKQRCKIFENVFSKNILEFYIENTSGCRSTKFQKSLKIYPPYQIYPILQTNLCKRYILITELRNQAFRNGFKFKMSLIVQNVPNSTKHPLRKRPSKSHILKYSLKMLVKVGAGDVLHWRGYFLLGTFHAGTFRLGTFCEGTFRKETFHKIGRAHV